MPIKIKNAHLHHYQNMEQLESLIFSTINIVWRFYFQVFYQIDKVRR